MVEQITAIIATQGNEDYGAQRPVVEAIPVSAPATNVLRRQKTPKHHCRFISGFLRDRPGLKSTQRDSSPQFSDQQREARQEISSQAAPQGN